MDDATTARHDRRAELAAGLAQVRARIAAACAAAGRDRTEVTMIAVTKTYPAADVLLLAGLGVTDVGENRDQEAAPKAAEVAAAGATPRWHFIGQLQRNKCRSVVRYADVGALGRQRAAGPRARRRRERERERPLDVLVQVSLDGDAERGGAVADADATPEQGLDRVAAAVAGGRAAAAGRPDGGGAAGLGAGREPSPGWPRSPRRCAPTIRRPRRSRRG